MAHPDNDPTVAGGRPRPSADTDPGRAHPYESLYRGGTGEPAARSTPRHYEQALSRPDGTSEGQFGWLYRPDDAGQDQTRVNPALGGPPSSAPPPDPAARPRATGLPIQLAARPPEPPDETSTRRGYGWLIALLALLVVVAGGVGVGMYLSPQQAPTRTAASGPPKASAPAEDPGSEAPSADANAPVTPAEAAVSCQAPPATDDAGNKVSYAPDQMYDGDPGTAWRCNGSGSDQTIIFTFDGEVTLTEVSLVNGYTKVDPASRNDRYGEYRRVSEVRWTFPDGTAHEQKLRDGVEEPQTLEIPPTKAEEITLTIVKSTSPGSKLRTRNAVLISEVGFAG